MSQPVLLQDRFTHMVQDLPRHSLPKGAVWNMQDWIPDHMESLTRRGPWLNLSNDISAAASGATYVQNLAWAPFDAGDKLVAFTDNGKSVTVGGDGTVTQITATSNNPYQTAMLNELLVIPDNDGTTAPQKYNGSTQASLGGSPPSFTLCVAWKGRIYAARSTANLARVWASGILNSESWDTTNGYFDMTLPVTAMAALPNYLLIWSRKTTSRIRGTTPPPGGDLIKDDPLFEQGCHDVRSVAVNGRRCVFGASDGLYMTDGQFLEDLTETCGIKQFWMRQMAGFIPLTWSIAGGFLRGRYIVCVMNGSTFKFALSVDIDNRRAYRFTNFPFMAFTFANPGWPNATNQLFSQELYAARRDDDRVAMTSPIYTIGSAATPALHSDPNSVDIAPVLETPAYWDPRTSKKRWDDIYLYNRLVELDTPDSATLTVGYNADNAFNTDLSYAYTSLSPVISPDSDGFKYVRRSINQAAHMMAFKIHQTNASSRTGIAAILADVNAREGSRVDT